MWWTTFYVINLGITDLLDEKLCDHTLGRKVCIRMKYCSLFFLMIITVNLSKTVYDESHQKVGFSNTHSCTLTKLLVFSKMCKTTHQKHIWVVWDLLEAGEPLSYAIKKETNGLYIQYIYCSVLKYFLQMQ